MLTHPFKPRIPKKATKLLVGTLPPDEVQFYFSNSSNTRLWDILTAIKNGDNYVGSGGNNLSGEEKVEILKELKIGICDIIYTYERDEFHSTKDIHINPKSYNDLVKLALDNNIEELLFVYQSALKWFIHSLKKIEPIRLKQIGVKYKVGRQEEINIQGKIIKSTLLPSPLSRGRKDETLAFKLRTYRKFILEE